MMVKMDRLVVANMIISRGKAPVPGTNMAILVPGTGALPLLMIMLATTSLSILTIIYVIKRTRDLEIANPQS